MAGSCTSLPISNQISNAIQTGRHDRHDLLSSMVKRRQRNSLFWVFIRGHNELDDPSLTQPLMYNRISSRQSVPNLYAQEIAVQ